MSRISYRLLYLYSHTVTNPIMADMSFTRAIIRGTIMFEVLDGVPVYYESNMGWRGR